mmetsp:Transcript_21877/g.57077  ORF Transcript_21877/g.57077 Transcript_21877/m.57077 type:complete len:92 (+) Transcript_21877:2004-2279(+)
MEAIKRSFEHAYYVLTSTFLEAGSGSGRGRELLSGDSPTQLSRIIKLSREVVQYRMGSQPTGPTAAQPLTPAPPPPRQAVLAAWQKVMSGA